MTHLLCRNRVADFERWLGVFASHREAHVEAGLVLEHLWRAAEDPNQIHYLFRVGDLAAAKAFIAAPDAADAAGEAGVLDGEFHFVDAAGGY
jgi:hypothetical protein